MSNSRNSPNDRYGTHLSPVNSNDDRSSFVSTNGSDKNGSVNGSAAYGSPKTPGAYSDNGSVRHGHRTSSRGSGSDFYSEDDSDNSEGYADGAGHLESAKQRDRHRRPSTLQEESLRNSGISGGGGHNNSLSHGSFSSPAQRIASSERRNRSNSIGVNRMSLSDAPLSYFHRHNCGAFSVRNEFRYYVSHLKHLYETIEEDRLPWKTDFADAQKMGFPRKVKEVAGRLNLNIPYYSSNYVEVFYVVTMPFLLVFNTPFFLVTFLTMAMIHSVALRRRNTQVYGESVTVLGRPISYRNLAHVLLFAFVMLFMFFNGLKTMMWVIVLNLCVIVPHAVLRKPTYFDDEELEKCRPKLIQYGIVLLLLGLDYLEGDVSDNDETMSRRLVEREKKRLAAVLEKREGKG
ncbi:hypothetical protein ABB37_04527 [Leptomonas pyrrhocoris]|uniref:PRA1 family protein n=1 Tax=Leptomonas pyrrhocoris TaxID=157538 RepID=A0A0M9G343_LEPPY|nr:hypothetical protein ABB37_04527 [Leptomonas pyrrhocoris]KPA81189.1 hypothetical protein ABB37_04527 [Leptomonas pyrrhocoris]|eukprot:XP_015659628.1 hypothetical protein ABB37_04527 [Leptomonas pyrrhocoris]